MGTGQAGRVELLCVSVYHFKSHLHPPTKTISPRDQLSILILILIQIHGGKDQFDESLFCGDGELTREGIGFDVTVDGVEVRV